MSLIPLLFAESPSAVRSACGLPAVCAQHSARPDRDGIHDQPRWLFFFLCLVSLEGSLLQCLDGDTAETWLFI